MQIIIRNIFRKIMFLQVSEGAKNQHERLQLNICAARLAESATSLSRLSEQLNRDELLGDFAARNAAVAEETAACALQEERDAAELRELLATLPAEVHNAGRSEEVVVLQAGQTPLLADTRSPPDADVADLYRIAALAPPVASQR